MGFSRRFALRLAVRLAMFGIATVALVCCISHGGWPTTTIIAGGMVVWAAMAVWSFANRTNVELARFVSALNQRDLAQSFTTNGSGQRFRRVELRVQWCHPNAARAARQGHRGQ